MTDPVLDYIRAKGRANYVDMLADLRMTSADLYARLNTLITLNLIDVHLMPHSAREFTIATPKPKNATSKKSYR
ncbi:hypothetical protein HUU59_11065 [bacterium]|nr:hypothetical protein [bacterium]